jgi:hypothetical protein
MIGNGLSLFMHFFLKLRIPINSKILQVFNREGLAYRNVFEKKTLNFFFLKGHIF